MIDKQSRLRQRAYEHRLHKQGKTATLIVGTTVYHLPAYWQPTISGNRQEAECGRRGLPLPMTVDAIALRVLCRKCLLRVNLPTAAEAREMRTTNS